jgi:hypothetical protein
MTRYYIHQFHDGEWIRDDEGDEFLSLEKLKLELTAAAREIMADRLIKGEAPDHSRFEVVDEEGRTILVFPFKDAIPGNGEHSRG